MAHVLETTTLQRATQPLRAWGYEDIAAYIRLADSQFGTPVGRPFEVLEAGGGSASHVPLPPDARITTIDISPEQIARNTYAAEAIVGDLETFDYGERRFDMVVAWDVLEHLSRPDAALERLIGVLRPGGRIVVVGPLPRSFKGLLTSLTPHWVHVAFYRYVLGSPTAGQPGHAPFPTEHAAAADPEIMAEAMRAAGLDVRSQVMYESAHVEALRERSRLGYGAYRAAEWLAGTLSRSRIQSHATDFCLIAVRPG
jgi:SAM-dependent methyltransferase